MSDVGWRTRTEQISSKIIQNITVKVNKVYGKIRIKFLHKKYIIYVLHNYYLHILV
jgi:hypothetical protein